MIDLVSFCILYLWVLELRSCSVVVFIRVKVGVEIKVLKNVIRNKVIKYFVVFSFIWIVVFLFRLIKSLRDYGLGFL